MKSVVASGVAGPGASDQFGAKGWVGDCDKRTDSFSERAAAQFRDAMLGDHEVGLGARRRDDPVGQLGDDARTGAFAISRLQRDDRTPLRGAVGGTDKIHLPADKADMSSPSGLGVDLTGQVNLERAIDRDEAAEIA